MMPTAVSSWRDPPGLLRVLSDEVHVWRASLDQDPPARRAMQSTLSPDEWDRARRFYFEKDRHRYVMARGMLRVILSRYLNVAPGQIRFHYNRYGKPRIMDPAGTEWLTFNVSHSSDLVLIAIAHGRKIGVDLEQIRQDVSYDQVAQRFFSPQEYAMLQSFTGAEAKRKAFFDCWTRKEAYIKAQGQGLSIPLEQFDVSLDPDEPARLLANRTDPEDVSRWLLQGIGPGKGYTGAVAVEGNDWRLTCFDYIAS